MAELLDRIETQEAVTWVIQFHLLSLTDNDLRDFGLDVTPALQVATAFALASHGGSAVSADVAGGLSAVLRASRTNSTDAIVAEPMFLLMDGGKGSWSRGQKYPVATQTVAGQTGAVTTTGVQYLQTGLQCNIGVREVSQRMVRLDCDLTLSNFQGYSPQNYPIIESENLNGSAYVESGGTYLLGTLKRLDDSLSRTNWLHWGASRTRQLEDLQVWMRCYKIGGDVLGADVAAESKEVLRADPFAGRVVRLPATGVSR